MSHVPPETKAQRGRATNPKSHRCYCWLTQPWPGAGVWRATRRKGVPFVESQSRGPQCGLGALSPALSLPASKQPLALGEPHTCRGAPHCPGRQCPRFIFRSRVCVPISQGDCWQAAVSVTRAWIAAERGPLCVLSMKNTPFRERIQQGFHRERRQPRWEKKMRTIQIFHSIFY